MKRSSNSSSAMSPSRATTRRTLQARDDPRLPPIRPFGSDVQLGGTIFRPREGLVRARETRVRSVPEGSRVHVETGMWPDALQRRRRRLNPALFRVVTQ